MAWRMAPGAWPRAHGEDSQLLPHSRRNAPLPPQCPCPELTVCCYIFCRSNSSLSFLRNLLEFNIIFIFLLFHAGGCFG
jgi:hypothetical protein